MVAAPMRSIAGGRATAMGSCAPGAPADRAVAGVARRPGSSALRCRLVVDVPDIGAPLKDVAVHVVEPEGIRRVARDGDRRTERHPFRRVRVGLLRVHVRDLAREHLAAVNRSPSSRAVRMLPLRLARQAKFESGPNREARAELDCVDPVEVLDGAVRADEARGRGVEPPPAYGLARPKSPGELSLRALSDLENPLVSPIRGNGMEVWAWLYDASRS